MRDGSVSDATEALMAGASVPSLIATPEEIVARLCDVERLVSEIGVRLAVLEAANVRTSLRSRVMRERRRMGHRGR